MRRPSADRRPGEGCEWEYRDGGLMFLAHAYQFPDGWRCAWDFTSEDGKRCGKGIPMRLFLPDGMRQQNEPDPGPAAPTKAAAIAPVLREMVERIEYDRSPAYTKFHAWLVVVLAVWELPLFAIAGGE